MPTTGIPPSVLPPTHLHTHQCCALPPKVTVQAASTSTPMNLFLRADGLLMVIISVKILNPNDLLAVITENPVLMFLPRDTSRQVSTSHMEVIMAVLVDIINHTNQVMDPVIWTQKTVSNTVPNNSTLAIP